MLSAQNHGPCIGFGSHFRAVTGSRIPRLAGLHPSARSGHESSGSIFACPTRGDLPQFKNSTPFLLNNQTWQLGPKAV
ncbi:MAG: hypothetical protein ACFFGP_16705 [Promethearchaeota archaeon]